MHRAQQFAPRFFAGGAVGDDLAQHRVIERADALAFQHAVVNPYSGGRLPAQHVAGLRQEALGRVFGVQAYFHGMPGQGHVGLGQWQWLAGGDLQLPGHQVEPGDQLGDRVLHLQAGVHFQEVKAPVAVEQKLHGAGAHVVHRAPSLERGLAHGLAQVGRHHWAGRFFDDFLMAALHRAVALAQVYQLAVTVAEHLDFDVTRLNQRLFQNQLGAAEGVERFGACRTQLRQQLILLMDQAHATPTAAGTGLDHQRVADAFGVALQGRVILIGALVARNARHAGLQHGQLGQAFAAHQLDRFGAGADKGKPGVLAGAGEVGVFREKAVAGVHRVSAGFMRGIEDRRDIEVGQLHRGGADVHGFVGHLHMQGVGVGIAVYRHGAIAQGLSRALDATGDLAAIGDQDFAECGHWKVPWLCAVWSGLIGGEPPPTFGTSPRGWRHLHQPGLRLCTKACVPSIPSALATASANHCAA